MSKGRDQTIYHIYFTDILYLFQFFIFILVDSAT